MSYNDTFSKLVHYFSCVTSDPFEYNGQIIEPKYLHVSPGIIRGYKCPSHCGGCCQKFTLDYLPKEDKPQLVEERYIEFNGKSFLIFTDKQEDNKTNRCRYLIKEDGRCGNYMTRPFSCDFELIRFIGRRDINHVTTRLFGRGWNMVRVDGQKGAKCEITPADQESRLDTIRKLRRLQDWEKYFGLNTKTERIIEWAKEVPFNTNIPLII